MVGKNLSRKIPRDVAVKQGLRDIQRHIRRVCKATAVINGKEFCKRVRIGFNVIVRGQDCELELLGQFRLVNKHTIGKNLRREPPECHRSDRT